jgi:hypothetical protein
VIAGLIAVAAILVGLPLLAWWIGGRNVWNRLRPSTAGDPWFQLVRGHGLTGAEASRVIAAVSSGRALDGERLRRAAFEWATHVRDVQFRPRRRSRILLICAVLYGLLLVAGAYWAIVEGRPLQIPWTGIFVVATFVLLRYGQRRNVLRAIELNREPSDP